jgi:hypothetical protein
LIQKSTPQPEIIKTPSGGTGCLVSESVICDLCRLLLASRQQGLERFGSLMEGVLDEELGHDRSFARELTE